MKVKDLSIAGLKIIEPRIFPDERGFFFESYSYPIYAAAGIDIPFVQDNVARSKKGTVRALHFQSGRGQAKLVSVLEGKIWDVAVDLRPNSPTFGKWEAIELDDKSHAQFFIPTGFAHGYCVLSETALVQYKVSSVYDPAAEQSIRWNDPDLKINWPIKDPILSERDRAASFWKRQ